MTERKLTVDLKKANIFAIVLLIAIAAVAAGIWYLAWGLPEFLTPAKEESDKVWLTHYLIKWGIVIAVFIGGTFLHELIHGITWAHFAPSGWKSISFGIIWKMLAPYCHSSEPLPVRHYIIGALMPLIILGILPLCVGLCIGSGWATIFGVFFTSAAAGDILVVGKLRHEKPTTTVLDHPTEAGCIVYEE